MQDAWLRWQTTDRSKVRDAAAFLATVTIRLALNVVESARVRHEVCCDPRALDPIDTDAIWVLQPSGARASSRSVGAAGAALGI